MATISSDVSFRVSQTGAAEVAQSLEKINQTTDRAGNSTSGLSKFIREQRTEQRQQNFLFREGAQALGSLTFAAIALSSSSGKASDAQKKLNQSLVIGYSSFQAVGLATSALGIATGGWTIAIQAVIGVGAGLLAFLDDTEERALKTKIAVEGLNFAMGSQKNIDPFLFENEIKIFKARQKAAEEILKEVENRKKIGGRFVTSSGGLISSDEQNKEIAQITAEIAANKSYVTAKTLTVRILREEYDERNRIDALRRKEWRLPPVEIKSPILDALRGKSEFDKRPEIPFRRPGMLGTGRPEENIGLLPSLEKQKEVLSILIMYEKSSKEITKLVGQREKIEESIAELLKTSGQKQLEIMGGIQLGASLLSSTLDLMGVKTDSVIQKLLKGLQAALQIFQTIQTIGTIFKIGSAVATAGASTVVSGATGLVSKAAEGGPGIKGGGVNITINAVDAHSIRRMMSDPANASAFASSIAGRQRLGKSSPFG